MRDRIADRIGVGTSPIGRTLRVRSVLRTSGDEQEPLVRGIHAAEHDLDFGSSQLRLEIEGVDPQSFGVYTQRFVVFTAPIHIEDRAKSFYILPQLLKLFWRQGVTLRQDRKRRIRRYERSIITIKNTSVIAGAQHTK